MTLPKFSIWISALNPTNVYWGGDLIKTADNLVEGSIELLDDLVRDILWDLYEQNFRFELLALDKCVLPRLAMSEGERSAREDMLSSLFLDGLGDPSSLADARQWLGGQRT